MEKVAEVFLELARQGGPVAKTLVVMYYSYWMFSAACIVSTIVGSVWLICRTILKYQQVDRSPRA